MFMCFGYIYTRLHGVRDGRSQNVGIKYLTHYPHLVLFYKLNCFLGYEEF